jgi:Holliday junction resolvase RusA-like endonuclease
MIELEIPHAPVPWTAARVCKGYTYDPKAEAKQIVRWHIQDQYNGPLIEGYTALFFTFIFPFPKSASKKTIEKMRTSQLFPTRCDTTNCQKLYEDCLKGTVIKDDRNVAFICSAKKYGPEPLVKIKVTNITTDWGGISLC